MSLFEELKRRKVFKVGAAYAVVAWLVIQVAATVAPQLGLPEWAPRLITLIALLGFPIAIVLAWMLDYSSEGIRVELAGFGHKRVFTAAAILAALALGWFLRGGAGSHEAAALGEKSTAVLPFVNMSADKDNEYFSDGLTENLLHKLAQVNEIKVAARTSSFAFKGKQEDIRGIGKALGVATVVEGSVQRAGDTLRITAQLVRTADGSHIWSQRYDRKLADLFAIQDEIAGAVAEALVGALVPEAKAAIAHGGTTNLSAYDDYTRGLQQLAHFSFDSLTQAEALLKKAIAADPKYLDAMVSLVRTFDRMQETGMISRTELAERAAPWLDRIGALDPGNAALSSFRARLASIRGDTDGARSLHTRAVEAAPNDAEIGLSYAQFLRGLQDHAAALEQADRALRLDPKNSLLHILRGRVLVALLRFEEARGAVQQALAADPKQPNSYGLLMDIAGAEGDVGGTVVWGMSAHKVDPRDHEVPTSVALAFGYLGEFEAADKWMAEAERLAPGHIFVGARRVDLMFLRGDLEAALERGLAFGTRGKENVRLSWPEALSNACYAGYSLGRGAELRARLEEFGAIPRRLTPEGFRALDAGNLGLSDQVRYAVGYFGPCMFDGGPEDAQRRKDMSATLVDVLGEKWAERDGLVFTDGFLRGDRDRMVQGLTPKKGRKDVDGLPWRELLARFAGVAEDPRLKDYFADARARIAKAKAELPERLKREGLQLMPAPAG